MGGLEGILGLVLLAMVIIGVVSGFSARLGVAAPLLLVLAGVGAAFIPGAPTIVLDPEVILELVLPPLLYAASRKVPFVDFRRNLTVISSLAVVLVLVSAAVAAGVVKAMMPTVPLALAVALGAVVAPPDAVAATSLGKRLGLPSRVVTILEGEGLVNDATALVLLSTALSLVDGGQVSGIGVVGSFVWAVLGAVLVGDLVALAAVKVRSRAGDAVLDTALALVTPFVSFLAAEAIDASGVVAVVCTGMVVGNHGIARLPASRRRAEAANWESFTMMAENGVFLVMGYLLPPVLRNVAADLPRVILVGLAVTVALIAVRFAYMPLVLASMRHSARIREQRQDRMEERFEQFDAIPESALDDRFVARLRQGRRRLQKARFDITAQRDEALGWRDSVVLSLAGMRGVVTIAGVQTLSSDDVHDPLVLVAFVVALATLLPQGFALPAVVRALRPPADEEADDHEADELVTLMGRLTDVARTSLEEEVARGGVDPKVEEVFRKRLDERSRRAAALGRGATGPAADLAPQMRRLRQAQLAAQRQAMAAERRMGEFSSESLAKAQRVLDDNEIQMERIEKEAAD